MKFLINNIDTDWNQFIANEFKKTYLIAIDNDLYNCNLNISPQACDIFRAFSFFNVSETKLVIFGQDPYPTPGIADGLAFSSRQENIPASLRNLFKKMEIDLCVKRSNPDLTDWARQGVLLLNTSLTVTTGEPNSHSKWGWKKFIISCIEYLNDRTSDVVFLLLGKNAHTLVQYIDQKKHIVMLRPHPSPLARNKIFEQDLFVELNNLIVAKKFYHMKW